MNLLVLLEVRAGSKPFLADFAPEWFVTRVDTRVPDQVRYLKNKGIQSYSSVRHEGGDLFWSNLLKKMTFHSLAHDSGTAFACRGFLRASAEMTITWNSGRISHYTYKKRGWVMWLCCCLAIFGTVSKLKIILESWVDQRTQTLNHMIKFLRNLNFVDLNYVAEFN